jgi:glycosyltransferase involved in cell wall biosynthesis
MTADRNVIPLVSAGRKLGIPTEIYGRGPEVDRYRSVANCHDYVSEAELQQILAGAFCVAILYDPSFPNNRFASPNKLFSAMKHGIPVIVSDGTGAADIVREERCGVVVPYGSERLAAEALLLIMDAGGRMEMSSRARAAYQREYNWRAQADRLFTMYEELEYETCS